MCGCPSPCLQLAICPKCPCLCCLGCAGPLPAHPEAAVCWLYLGSLWFKRNLTDMRHSRMGSLSKPSCPSLCALWTVREKRCFFPSLLPPASPGPAAVCCHPAGCPAGNKVAFCSAAPCYWCPCSGPGGPRACPGCAVPWGRESSVFSLSGAGLSGQAGVALLSQAAASSPC